MPGINFNQIKNCNTNGHSYFAPDRLPNIQDEHEGGKTMYGKIM